VPPLRSTRAVAIVCALALATASCSGDDPATDAGPSLAPTSTTAAVESPTTTIARSTTSVDEPSAGSSTTSTGATTSISTTTTGAATVDLRDGRPYEVETLTLTLADDTRPTTPLAGEPLPSRTLPTSLWVPITDRPVPLIVFSHGFGATPAKFERMLGAWAGAGYAVAAPTFPLTNDLITPEERIIGDVASQPGDVSFVLDQVLASELGDRLDRSHLAAAGLSLGGLTTYIAAIDESTRDDRFSAAIVMAAVPPGDSFRPHDIPVLVMHGEFDPLVPLDMATSTAARLTGPAYSVTMLGGFHADPFEDAEDNTVFPDSERFHPVVDATTIAFWDVFLAPVPADPSEIFAAADREGVSTVTSRR
jgi:pimeloyl-ACP methyl ester carboxylesterase